MGSARSGSSRLESADDLAGFAKDSRWQTARVGHGWTDDRSNIFDAISWDR